MAFDFAARPPEINSALMYSGSGAGPLMAASSSFSALSSELSSSAASYESIISQLGSEWTGPSSTAMAASAQTHITWLTTTSAQLQDAAAAATSSAAAYEAAHAATIPPPVVTANRVQLATLVATNILGQNTPAIAANEAMYGEFWAQDAAAMYGYSAAASAASSALTPLTDPTENTNPAGQGLQAAAVSNAVGGNGTSATLNNTLGSLQSALGSSASPLQSLAIPNPLQSIVANVPILSAINGLLGVPIVGNTIYNVGVTLAWNTAMMTATLPLLGHFVAGTPFGFTIGDATPLGAGLGFGTTLAGAQAPIGGAMAAGMGEASSVGGLSVPAGWSAATPAATVSDATLAGTGWTAAADEGAGMGGAPGIMPGMASAGGKSGMGFGGPRYGVKPKVMPKQVFV
jgi:PPE-repeat protein